MEKRAAAGPEGAPGARAQLAVVCLGKWAAQAGRVRATASQLRAAPGATPVRPAPPGSGRGFPERALRERAAPSTSPPSRPGLLRSRAWEATLAAEPRLPSGSRPARNSAWSPGQRGGRAARAAGVGRQWLSSGPGGLGPPELRTKPRRAGVRTAVP